MKHITPLRFLVGVLLVAFIFGLFGSYAAWSDMQAKKAEEAAVKAEQKKAVKPPSKRKQNQQKSRPE